MADMEVVGTMFFKEGKLLIDKPRSKKTYQMIGGRVEEGETALEAAIREAHEELGEKAFFDESKFAYIMDFEEVCTSDPTKTIHMSVFQYNGILEGTLTISEEIEDFKWFGSKDDEAILSNTLHNKILPYCDLTEKFSRKKRAKSAVAVFLFLTRIENEKEQILLQLRQNTSFMDGYYDTAASGHIENEEALRESLSRETLEEINIVVNPKDLELITVLQNYDQNYLHFYFRPMTYEGNLKINEPEKCAKLEWFDLDSLPLNTAPYVQMAVENYLNNNKLTEYNAAEFQKRLKK